MLYSDVVTRGLCKKLTDQPDTKSQSQYEAQFRVVLSPSGTLEVSPWDGWK